MEQMNEMTNEDAVWRDFINGLDIMSSLKDDDPIEDAVPEEEENDETKLLKNQAAVTRLRMDVYLISPVGIEKAYMVNGNQAMEDMGIMTIREALEIIKRRKRKNT